MADEEKKAHKGYRQEPKPLTEAEKRTLAGLDLERTRTRKRKGCTTSFGCLFKILLVLLPIAGLIGFIWWLHPWETRSTQVPISSDLCTDDEQAVAFSEQFYVFGFEVSSKRKGTVCIEEDAATDDANDTTRK